MKPVLFVFAIVLQGIRGDIVDKTAHPEPRKYCDREVFISSLPIGDKVFLVPRDSSLRQADWYQNRAFCADNCAEAVILQDQTENDFFADFVAGQNNAEYTWIGGQARGATAFAWSKPNTNATYQNEYANQFSNNEICVHMTRGNKMWWTQPCLDKNFYVACQRSKDWTVCE